MTPLPDYRAVVANLRSRVQTNKECSLHCRQILDDCDALLVDAEFERDEFLVNKVQLIQRKAGKQTDLNALSVIFESPFKRDPTSLVLVISGAECLLQQDKADEAATYLETTRSLEVPSPDLFWLLSLCYRRKTAKHIPGSVGLAKEAMKLGMNNGKAWTVYAIALLVLTGPENVIASKKTFLTIVKLGKDRNADVCLNCGTGVDSCARKRIWIQERLKCVILRASAFVQLRPKRKHNLPAKVTDDNDLIEVDFASDPINIAQLAVAIDRGGLVVVLGFPKPTRAYLIIEPATAQINGLQLTSSIAWK